MCKKIRLPSVTTMVRAFLQSDSSFEGVFLTGVRTTGIFCRPSCRARKPKPEHLEFFPTAESALSAGYRPCRRCRPMQFRGQAPEWLRSLLEEVNRDPSRRWKDSDLRARGLEPGRVRRWFRTQHGMTFHAYQRAHRLGLALSRMREGQEQIMAAYDHGFDSLSGFRRAFQQWYKTTPARSCSQPVMATRILTPLGPMLACASERAVCMLEFTDGRRLKKEVSHLQTHLSCSVTPGRNDLLAQLEQELAAYFQGKLGRFTVPLEYPGTDFQRAVWAELRSIPYGETRSYQELARALGRPRAVRAVGRANGQNRLAILIPCHRVIGADGRLTGYGGGLWRKRLLLEGERCLWRA